MPDKLTSQEVNSKTDPSVAKQYDTETSTEQQIKDLFKTIDANKVGMLSTYRKGTGPVGRSMALAKRSGPDLLFLANAHSRKFSDLKEAPECQVTFQDTKTQDWISVSGTCVTSSNSDPRIKDLWSRGAAAWFGDLGDGKHDGSASDPRMSLIEVKAKYVVYWLHQVGALGFVKEVGMAAVKGEVANTGVLRELGEKELEMARQMDTSS
ncbi:hypothetical protein P154DRAFT_435070 [Amniculicola lignicola CBS 123094]|uniref:General stress protein FMN-binding split barrel domain-containing protein n=1 Tax=Amniculicola lignicola CBS 123094 TaxID=1392246 RepID=A0A6A5WHR1_9PLEO|nr:hypothetical protein P154DRAFT_435070 [Amniculicola lignicola CBS 123094]